jgi:acetoin utilization protein AcuA
MTYQARRIMFPESLDAGTSEETRNGNVRIISHCPPDLFPKLRLDKGLGSFSHYSSIIGRTDYLAGIASTTDARITLALFKEDVIVGYGACLYPGPEDRWSKLGDLMYEMAALEVSRNFRNMNIGTRIFSATMADKEFFERKIAYMNGFSWHWDIEGTGLTSIEYRGMMLKLLSRHGFKEYYTNEPNIGVREENFFMVRIGSEVTPDDRDRFKNLRFGIESHERSRDGRTNREKER